MKKILILIIVFLLLSMSYVASQEASGEIEESILSVEELTGVDTEPEPIINEELLEETVFQSTIQEEISWPQLLITEVFFDGNDEWIELTNIGTNDFIGNLSLSGAKSTEVQLPNITIAQSASIIVGDSMTQIADTSYIQRSLLGLNILDTAAMHIILLYSGTTLDIFDQDAETVSSLPNKYGFEKVDQNGMYTILPTTPERVYNISGDWIANPGKVYTMNIQEETPSQIKITEVFFDGNDEWVEFTNVGTTTFEGDFTISGVATTAITKANITLPAGESIIFSDSTGFFVDISNIYINKTKFTLPDTKRIHIQLFINNNLSDEFVVHQAYVERYNDYQISFEKIGVGDERFTTKTTMDRRYNVIPPYVANPRKVFSTGENLENVSIAPIGEVVYTGELPISCSDTTPRVEAEITEVFFGNTVYDPYVEVHLLEDIAYDYFLLSGSMLEKPVEIYLDPETIQMEKNNTILLSNSEKRYNEGINNGYHPDFLLSKPAGRLVLYGGNGQMGQVLDIVYLTGGNTGLSLYYGAKDMECAKVLDETGSFSPEFDRKFLQYFAVSEEPKIEYIYLAETIPSYCPVCPSNNQLTSSYSGDIFVAPFGNIVKITKVEYDPEGKDAGNEKIGLLLLSGTTMDLSKIDLLVDGKKKKLVGNLYLGSEQIFTGTFGFPNTKTGGAIVTITLTYQDYIFDTYTYLPGAKTKLSSEEISGTYLVTSVIDGDTFRIKYKGKTRSIRLLGVDAPESNKTRYRYTQCFGSEAKTYLQNLIKGKKISFAFDETQDQEDLYERFLAYVYLDGEIINKKILEEGYAKEYTYKTAYQYQQVFKITESEAKEENKGLWNIATCGLSMSGINLQEELTGESRYSYAIEIRDLVFDPPGKDTDNESIYLYVLGGSTGEINTTVDLSDNVYLKIGERKKSLKSFGFLHEGENILTGNFALPNSKETCVKILQGEVEFDEFCYNPNEEMLSGKDEGYSITIQEILPNPEGKDEQKEKIRLFVRGEGTGEVDLSSGYYLLINKTKKKINGTLLFGEEKTFTGSFSFPNSSSCVRIGKGEKVFDTFCYADAKEGVVYTKTNERLEELEKEVPGVLHQLTLKKNDNKMCIEYAGITILCKAIPAGKLTTQQKNEIKLGRNYITFFMQYLKTNWGILVNNTEIKDYFSLYVQAKKLIKNQQYTISVYDEEISIYDLTKWYSKQYKTSLVDIEKINITKIMKGGIDALLAR